MAFSGPIASIAWTGLMLVSIDSQFSSSLKRSSVCRCRKKWQLLVEVRWLTVNLYKVGVRPETKKQWPFWNSGFLNSVVDPDRFQCGSSASGSRVVATQKMLYNFTTGKNLNFFQIISCNLFILRPPWSTSKLRPSKDNIKHLKTWNSFTLSIFVDPFLHFWSGSGSSRPKSVWIRIHSTAFWYTYTYTPPFPPPMTRCQGRRADIGSSFTYNFFPGYIPQDILTQKSHSTAMPVLRACWSLDRLFQRVWNR